MNTEHDEKDHVEQLSADVCWTLLRQVPIGRLAVWVEDHPEIFPLNFTVDRGTLVFRTDPGTKLTGALSGVPVALEADGLEAIGTVAWSVVVKGQAEQITRALELMDTADLPLLPWQTGQKGRFMRIVPTEVTGRRFPVAAPEWWRTPFSGTSRTAEE